VRFYEDGGMSELAVHPVAALFPMLADDELDELAADIKARGLRFPIIRDKEGKTLIDGRNRLIACENAGVQPDFITYAV
jgi:ParB-like chromosome segregation protein Spo0J